MAGSIISTIGSAWGASQQAGAANDATAAQSAAAAAALAEQQRQFNIQQANEAPWLQAGKGALTQLGQLNSGDMSSFHESPDYQWTLSQGIGALDKSAAARGNLGASGYGADLTNYAQGLASTQYGNYYNRIASLAGLGQTAVQGANQSSQNFANQSSNIYGNLGNAQASGYVANGNAWANFGNQIGNIAGNYFGNQSGGSPGYTPISQTSIGDYQPSGGGSFDPALLGGW